MNTTHKKLISALPPSSRGSFFSRLRQTKRGRAGYALVQLLLHSFHPIAWRVLSVAKPAGQVHIRPEPETPPRQVREPLTIISANLWHDWPRYRNLPQRLESFAQLIESEHADIVLLQEVARTPELQVDEWLAARLGMAYVYSRANGHQQAIGFEEGLAVFSRFPLQTPYLRQLGGGENSFVRRLALGASIETPFGNLLAVSVHLALPRRQNALQLDRLQAWIAEIAGGQSALIGGDFNAHERTPQIARARHAWLDTFHHLNPFADGTTHELHLGGKISLRKRLDYIFLHPGQQNWNIIESRKLAFADLPFSDHQPVMARLMPSV